jgi:myo-inositol-hexaphosphate 3-phosphohydrolase
MRRIRLVFAVVAVMVAMLLAVPGPAMAVDFDGDGFDDDTGSAVVFCDTDGDGFGDTDCGDVFGLGFGVPFDFGDGVSNEASNESETGTVSLSFTVS